MNSPIFIYDFDGTLTPYAWTKFEILERCGFDGGAYSQEFIDRVNTAAETENLDGYTALWQEYFRALEESGFSLTDENFTLGAQNLEYNPGVEDFLARTNAKNARNYILSSGLKIFLDHTKIASQFQKIYATTFAYDAENRATGVDFLMHEKNKVETLKRILNRDLADPSDLRDVVYFGDGLTDFYAMEYVKTRGGQTILVHQPESSRPENTKPGQITTPNKASTPNDPLSAFPNPGVITFKTLADYSPGSPLDNFVAQFLP